VKTKTKKHTHSQVVAMESNIMQRNSSVHDL